MYADEQTEMRDHNHEVFTEFFKLQDDWIMEYVQSDNYMSDYAFLLKESDSINREVARLLGKDYYFDDMTHDSPRDESGIPNEASLPLELNAFVVDAILYDDLFHIISKDEYESTREGYLDSFQIGEYENQIEISSIEETIKTNILFPDSETSFEDLLAEYVETSREHCLRGTRQDFDRQYACVYQYVLIGLRIDFEMDRNQWEQATTLGMLKYCRTYDRDRRDKLSVAS